MSLALSSRPSPLRRVVDSGIDVDTVADEAHNACTKHFFVSVAAMSFSADKVFLHCYLVSAISMTVVNNREIFGQ